MCLREFISQAHRAKHTGTWYAERFRNITFLEAHLCLLGLFHGRFFGHCDVGIEAASSFDAVQTFSAELRGGELALPQRAGDLIGCVTASMLQSQLQCNNIARDEGWLPTILYNLNYHILTD